MTSDYICKYGLWHDKKCTNKDPSSNNGWIYTAYAFHLGLVNSFDICVLHNIYSQCLLLDHPLYWVTRLPQKYKPPISRDEILGMIMLGVLPYEKIARHNFFMINSSFMRKNILKTLKAVWSLRNKHRNYVWENHVYYAYPVVFRLWFHDRYFIKKSYGKSVSILETIFWYLYLSLTYIKQDPGQMNMAYFQLKHLGSRFWIILFNHVQSIENYFGKEHIFYQFVSNKQKEK